MVIINFNLKKIMRKQKGFTLIELMIVVAIIGILASVVLTSLGKARSKAKDTAVMSELSGLRASAEIYATDNDDSYEGFCDDTSIDQVDKDTCSDDEGTWAAYKAFNVPSGDYIGYCVDSTGSAEKVTTALASGDTVCPHGQQGGGQQQ